MEDLTFRLPDESFARPDYLGTSSYRANPNSSEILECWHIIRRRKLLVSAVAVLGLVFAIAITLPQTPLYQSRASLEVQDINQEFMNLKELNPVADSNAINALSDLQTQIKILQSESLRDRTIAKLKTIFLTCPGIEEGPERGASTDSSSAPITVPGTFRFDRISYGKPGRNDC